MSAEVEGSAGLFFDLDSPPLVTGEVAGVDGVDVFDAGLSSRVATALLDFFFLVIFVVLFRYSTLDLSDFPTCRYLFAWQREYYASTRLFDELMLEIVTSRHLISRTAARNDKG